MKNLSLIIISLILLVGISTVAFMNLPENNSVTKETSIDESSSMEDNLLNVIPEENNVISSDSNTSTQFTVEEVSTHNTKDDCYLIIRDNVYDVSSFIDSHPGGVKKISEQCGKEVSGIFAQIHSNRAWDLLVDYKIGTIQN